jgi:hypothetical protein
MSLRSFSIAILFACAIALPSRGGLIISEVCFNEVGSTADGEWIEIYNDTGAAIDLSNYKIGDEEQSGGTSTTEALFKFPAGASIAPGEVQVISGGATRFFTVYGINPTYETAATDPTIPDLTIYSAWDPDGGILNMSNTNDQAVIVDPTDTIIDSTSWGNNFSFNPSVDITGNLDGQSIERIYANVDTNTASDWKLGPTTSPAATRSTPFSVVLVPEPSSLVLLIGGVLAFVARRQR